MPKGLRRDALIHSLQDMHAHYARLADSIQTTLQLLQDQHRTHVRPHMASMLGEAMALDQERRAAKNGRLHAGLTQAEAAAQMGVPQRTLAKYEAGLIAKPAGKKKPQYKRLSRVEILAQRKRSAAFLAKFSPTEPRRLSVRGMGTLVRRGYLAKKGTGFIRTAKPYVLNPF